MAVISGGGTTGLDVMSYSSAPLEGAVVTHIPGRRCAAHPMEFLRSELSKKRIVTCADAMAERDGRWLSTAEDGEDMFQCARRTPGSGVFQTSGDPFTQV